MRKAFAIAGYGDNTLEAQFGGMLRALQFGAPPHGGMAAGLDRIVMLLCGVKNLREITMFPMNQQAEDLVDGRALGGDAEAAPRAAHPGGGARTSEMGRRNAAPSGLLRRRFRPQRQIEEVRQPHRVAGRAHQVQRRRAGSVAETSA